MKLLTTKYKSNLSRFLLTIYLLLFVSNILHHHCYIFSNTESVEKRNNLLANHFQVVDGINYECIIQQNLTSLQTTLISEFFDHQLIIDEKVYFQNSTSQLYLIHFHLTDNPLRAPPALS